VCNIVSYTVVS